LAEAVTEIKFQTAQAQRELRRRRQEQQQQQQQQSAPAVVPPPKSNFTITRIENNKTNNNSTTTTTVTPTAVVVPLSEEEIQKQEQERILKLREAALDEFISETSKLLFVKIRPHMDVISLLFTKSSRYLDDLNQAGNNNNNNNNNKNSSSSIVSGDAGGGFNSNDQRIATHFFYCFALTKTDADAQESFRKELKEMRSRYFQDLMHTVNEMGAIGILNAGIETVKSFFGGERK
jgi:hypothetical protein